MLAVCDGGSTKADWRILTEDNTVQSLATAGFNPNYDAEDRIAALLQEELVPHLPSAQGAQVFYYGSGCSASVGKAVVTRALKGVFPNADIEVNTDLLAAARAVCGRQAGIACILGTGSNSVLFDGEKEADQIPNLGYLLGDEGSGGMIGRRLVQAFFYREMPEELRPIMERKCPNGRQDVLEKVYEGDAAAAYLASFVHLFAEHGRHPFIREIVGAGFREFLLRHVCKYEGHQNLPIHFVGSIAWNFREILKEALDSLRLNCGEILQRPIEKLFDYHRWQNYFDQ